MDDGEFGDVELGGGGFGVGFVGWGFWCCSSDGVCCLSFRYEGIIVSWLLRKERGNKFCWYK